MVVFAKVKVMQNEEKKSVALVHKPHIKSASSYEDFVSSIGVIMVSVAFLLYVAFLSISQTYQIGGKTAAGNGAGMSLPFFSSKPNCDKMNDNFEACVKSQAGGSGCSWYADCRKCIEGGHSGKSREEICGNK